MYILDIYSSEICVRVRVCTHTTVLFILSLDIINLAYIYIVDEYTVDIYMHP